MKNLQNKINAGWYGSSKWWMFVLLPLSIVFSIIVNIRYWLYKKKLKHSTKLDVPVIIVGNITVGGTGKTPLVIYLAKLLCRHGYRPGIVTRGYGGENKVCHTVTAYSKVNQVGDEAILIAQRTNCPLVVGHHRVAAVKKLLIEYQCDVVISDDGLQHYALARDIEIVVIDGLRRFGNNLLLPAGPLREPTKRLKTADFIVNNSGKVGLDEFSMELLKDKLYNLVRPKKTVTLADWQGKTVHAVAGIGHPQRFFAVLRLAGLKVLTHCFADHYIYQAKDVDFADGFAVIMTEKDAVKCQQFNNEQLWCLPITAQLSVEFDAKLLRCLAQIKTRDEKTVYGVSK